MNDARCMILLKSGAESTEGIVLIHKERQGDSDNRRKNDEYYEEKSIFQFFPPNYDSSKEEQVTDVEETVGSGRSGESEKQTCSEKLTLKAVIQPSKSQSTKQRL